MIQDESPIPEHPEIVVFASYSGPPKYPVRISVLGEMVSYASFCILILSHIYDRPLKTTHLIFQRNVYKLWLEHHKFPSNAIS